MTPQAAPGGNPDDARPCRLLLVSDSRHWSQAVHAAAAEIGCISVASVAAREAVLRLSATRERYSHLLLQPGSADGWLTELVHLSAAAGASPTEMLLLGAPDRLPPRVGVIASADRQSVRQALRPAASTSGEIEPRMQPTELSQALQGAMIDTRYQPIVRISDRRPVALEALARLNHPTRGTLLPDHFIPQMENAGLAAQLTEVVATRAFADLQGVLAPLGMTLTLNLPLDVLLVPDALARLDALRRNAGIPAHRVAIELTESRPVQDFAVLGGALAALRADNYRISLDDIAPGVPGVEQLLDLPFTTIKLDKLVVQQAERPEMARFIAMVAAAARRQGMRLVAEGVEDPATWHRIHALGADHAQGFLVARPLPVTAVPVWFEAWVSQPAF